MSECPPHSRPRKHWYWGRWRLGLGVCQLSTKHGQDEGWGLQKEHL